MDVTTPGKALRWTPHDRLRPGYGRFHDGAKIAGWMEVRQGPDQSWKGYPPWGGHRVVVPLPASPGMDGWATAEDAMAAMDLLYEG